MIKSLLRFSFILILLSFNINCVEKEKSENKPISYNKEEIRALFDDKLSEEVTDIMVMIGGSGIKNPPPKKEYVEDISDSEEGECFYNCCNICLMIMFFGK